MRNLYNILTYIVDFHLRLIALFNHKLSLGVKGRKSTLEKLKTYIGETEKTLWFHCASLGEYEQGLPVFEAIKSDYQDHKILLSFFSPSGYEIRKDSPIADLVVYLPLDTKRNARQFLDLAHPELIVFVKYEIWPNYLLEIKKRNIKAVLISALFRPDQTYFKSAGRWMLKSLEAFSWIFVQDDASVNLLKKHDITHVSRSGDTRFDRVTGQLAVDNSLDFLDEFINGQLCVVAGSIWPEGETLFSKFINADRTDTKYVIAPHNIKPNEIQKLKNSLRKPTVIYSERAGADLKEQKVLILDTIGLLSKVYASAHIAYVGGALGTSGLHNTLEPAVFGIPIIIGKNYQRFPEAHEMIRRGGMFSFSELNELNYILSQMISDTGKREMAGQKNKKFIEENTGAVIQIMSYLRK